MHIPTTMMLPATMDFVGKPVNIGLVALGILVTAILGRIFYMQKLHPLAKFHGPWYATSFSIVSAVVSMVGKEPEWLTYLEKQYGCKATFRSLMTTKL
jgi:hypothetical protein